MKISANTAMKLIKSLSSTLTNQIGIIDLNGMIVAHTNQQLIGSYSQTALSLYTSAKSMAIISESEKNSIDIPGVYSVISINQKPYGTLLVQYGPQSLDDLLPICELVKQICTHTIIEAMSSNYYNIKNYDRNLFLSDWLKGYYQDNRSNFSRDAREYGIKPEAGSTAAILRIYHIAFNRTLFYDVFDHLTESGCFVVADDNDFNIIFNSTDSSVLNTQVEQISEYLNTRAPNHLLTIGSPQRNCSKLRESYLIAKRMQNLYYGKENGTLFYADCILDLCFEEVPQHYKEAFVHNVFKNCAHKDISAYCAFINTYIESNGSLKLIAEKLFTYTNTVQYRIERLKQKTGLDLRNYSDAFQLYMAAFWSNQTLGLSLTSHSMQTLN